MRCNIAVVLIVLLAGAFAIPFVCSDISDSSGDDPRYRIEGHIAAPSGMGKTALGGVEVTIFESVGNNQSSGMTDSNGHFSVGVNSNVNLRISFTKEGYTIIACDNTTPIDGSTMFNLDLSKAEFSLVSSTYTITGPINSMNCAIMSQTIGSVSGKVSYSNNIVKEATIILTSNEGLRLSTTSNSDGSYRIDCPTGEYRLKVVCKGFQDYEYDEDITITAGYTANKDVLLTRTPPNLILFGMDYVHILMLIGIAIGMTMAFLVYVKSRRMANDDEVTIVDDEPYYEE